MEKVFAAYARRAGVDVESIRFMLDGERMFSNLTPRDYELKENDLIQAIHEAVGC